MNRIYSIVDTATNHYDRLSLLYFCVFDCKEYYYELRKKLSIFNSHAPNTIFHRAVVGTRIKKNEYCFR